MNARAAEIQEQTRVVRGALMRHKYYALMQGRTDEARQMGQLSRGIERSADSMSIMLAELSLGSASLRNVAA